MAFTATKNFEGYVQSTVFGDKKVVYGTYVNDSGSTGGEIVTGLTRVEFFVMQAKGAAVSANQSVINETLPLVSATGSLTVINNANETGYYIAIGN